MRKLLMSSAAVALLATSALADYSNTVASLNPLAYWRLNETVVPPADTGVNLGTLGAAAKPYYVGNATHAVAGALVGSTDTAASFDGASGKVAVPYIPSLALNASFSVEAWVKPNIAFTDGTLTAVLSCGQLAGNRSGWLVYQSSGGWNLRMYNQNGGNTVANVTGGSAPVVGTWYHLVVVYDGTNAKIYVNGVAATGTLGSPAFVPNTDGPLTIGARSDNGFYYNGAVDEVAVYTNALSQADVTTHYQNGINAAPATPYDQVVLAANPLVYLRLNEPAYTAPDPASYPVAQNSGSLGTAADGRYRPGSFAGAAGAPNTGFGPGNYGAAFDYATGGWIDAGAPPELNFTGPFSVVTWFKGTPADPRFRSFIGKGDSSWRAGVDGDGKARFAFGNNPDATGTSIVNDGKWHQLAGVYSGTNLQLYIDGILETTVNAPNVIGGNSANVLIGTVPDYGAGRMLKGGLDEVAVFGTNLTVTQIRQIYASANVAPRFIVNPVSPGTVNEGDNVTLFASAFGTETVGYQWIKNGTNLVGKTATNLVLTATILSDSGAYALVATNAFGAVTSSVVNLTVQAGPPIVLTQPKSASRYAGLGATLTVVGGGSNPLSYQWLFNTNTILNGQTSATLALTGLQASQDGFYSCKITNPYGSITSAVAKVTVVAAPTNLYPATILADAPISYLRLGESSGTNAIDYVGGFDGVYTNVALGRPGYSVTDSNTAAGFAAATTPSYVGAINGIDFASPSTVPSFTVEAWVNGGAQSGDAGIITKGTGAGGEQFNLDTGNGGAFRFFVRDAGGGAHLVNSSFRPDGLWHHLVMVCDGSLGVLTLYVDGQPNAQATIAGGILATPQPFTIGARRSGTAAYDLQFNGVIDEVAFYTNALDGGKIANHYNARYEANARPVIVTSPASVTNYAAIPYGLTVDAGGPEPLTYQWQLNGTNLVDATGRTLSLGALSTNAAGSYRVIVSNPSGSVTSSVAVVGVLAAPEFLNISVDLVLHLPFDGDNKDISGRGNNGTNVGNTAYFGGKVGTGALYYFTDTGSASFNYVTLGQRPDLKFGNNVNFSVAYWVKLSAGAAGGDLPFFCNAAGSYGSPGYTFAPSYNQGGWSWSLNGTGIYGGQNTVNDGEWHHLVHTFDRTGNGVTYLDGVIVDSRSVAAVGNIDQNAPTNIGQDPNGNYGESGSATLDDLGVWRRVLTANEVAAIYSAGKVNSVSFAPTIVGLTLQKVGNNLQLVWPSGVLQGATDVSGSYTNVPGAVSPLTVTPSEPKGFFRVKVQ